MNTTEHGKSKKTIGIQADDASSWFMGNTEFGKKFNQFTKGKTYMIISTLIMIYSLFSDDIRYLLFPASADEGFSILTVICMIYYLFEIISFSLFQKDYFLKYYFWLDLMSTLTMCFDLIWISQYITGGGKTAANISQISRASRAARLGTRTVKLIRLIRMIKLLRQMKIYTKGIGKTQKKIAAENKKDAFEKISHHSKLTSNKHVERLSSFRHMQKIPSKRWSLIKETGCMNVLQANQPVQTISINCLPFKEQDEIIDRQSIKSISSKKIQSFKKIKEAKEMQNINHPHYGDSSNIVVVPLEKINQQIKEQKQQDNNQQMIVNKQIVNNNKKSKNSIRNKDINQDQDFQSQLQIPNQSKVGQKLQSQIQKNVILLIILILVSIPLLQGSTWFQTVSVYDKSLMNLVYFAANHPAQYTIQASIFIDKTTKFNNPLAFFKVTTENITDQFPKNYPSYPQDLLLNRRESDIQTFTYLNSEIGFDSRSSNALDSLMNIGRTLFVCIMLILTTLFFSNDLEFAAIAPLEEMFDTVRKIAIHPLNALRQIQEKNLCFDNIELQQNKQITEPRILQNTIVKIGSLLAIGFGEAGTQIICRVIEDPSIINVMIPGNKIMAIFGFCDIRNFTDATQILEADVMLFVNQIAHICHKVTYQHLGSPNKNIGDAFLLVWKFTEDDCKITQNQNSVNIELNKSSRVQQKADLAVLSIIKMIADITKSKKLQKYKHHAGLKQRIPDYNGVKMGFGLHVGWAIEGPIGSQYKIDASYLSSHVHMASRLQAATKGYGTGMLITGDVYKLMDKNQNYLRHIDRVLPSGQSQLIDLYTVDIDTKHLYQVSGVTEQKKLSQKQKKMAKVIQNINRRELLQSIAKEGATNALWNDNDIKIMKQTYKKQFYDVWNIGFKQYLQGDWSAALQNLKQSKECAPYNFDGPSQSLIKYIQLNSGIAPQNWKGFRDFD